MIVDKEVKGNNVPRTEEVSHNLFLRVLFAVFSPVKKGATWLLSPLITLTEHLKEVDKPGLNSFPLNPAHPPAEPPLHGHGWPQETVPTPISRAMVFCLENCLLAQYSKESNGLFGLFREKM